MDFPDENVIAKIAITISEKIQVAEQMAEQMSTSRISSTNSVENVENIKYTYKLNGFDEEWSNWSSATIKEYTNLREGKYTMNVKVKNSFGIISDTASIPFTISPPWYRHFIAYLFYLILIGATIRVTRDRIKIKIRRNKYYERCLDIWHPHHL